MSDALDRPPRLYVELDEHAGVRAVRGEAARTAGIAVGAGAVELLMSVHPDERDRAVAVARTLAAAPTGTEAAAVLRVQRAGGSWHSYRIWARREAAGGVLTVTAARRQPPRGDPDLGSTSLALVPVPLGVVGDDGRFHAANPALCELLGYEEPELLSRGPLALVHPDDGPASGALAAVLAAGADEAAAPVRWLRADGTPIRAIEHRSLRGGATIVHLSTVAPTRPTDVSDAMIAVALVDASPALLLAVDAAGRILNVNPAAAVLAGRDAESAVGAWPDALYPAPAGDPRLSDLVERAAGQRAAVAEDIRFVAPDDTIRVLSWTAAPLRHPGSVAGVALLATDVTERQAAIADLSHRALHDPLTRLPNRTLFYERLRHALTRLERGEHELAVLFLDLNHFKEVNDRFGHDAGDRLLLVLADRFRAAIRPSDTVARIGGDEFVVLCEELPDGETALTIADRLIEAVESPFSLDGDDVRISAAIGLAFARHAGEEPDALVRQADAAMYEAKGKGQPVTARADVPDQPPPRPMDADELRAAIDRGDLVVLYQPQIELPAGRIVGVEALVRIRHAQLGLLPPAAFLPVAEESGLIDAIGAEVVRQVCHRLAGWRVISPLLRVTVNLSARELMATDPARRFDVALREAGLDADSIVVDVREDVLLANHPDALRSLRDLKALGVRIAVDDAGVRFTASEALRELGVDEVKVGGDHVRQLGRDRDQSPVVASIVRLARALDLWTVAEGVETEDQLAALRLMGCDAGQGFLFAGPQPAEVIDRLLGPGLRWPTDVAVT